MAGALNVVSPGRGKGREDRKRQGPAAESPLEGVGARAGTDDGNAAEHAGAAAPKQRQQFRRP